MRRYGTVLATVAVVLCFVSLPLWAAGDATEGDKLAGLAAEVQALRAEVRGLRAQVAKLEQRVRELEAQTEDKKADVEETAAAPSKQVRFRVKALVHGNAELILQGDKMHWKNTLHAVVGYHSGEKKHYPVLINGKPWRLKWKYEQTSGENESARAPLPFTVPQDGEVKVQIREIKGRAPVKASYEGGRAVIKVYDPAPGNDWFEFDVMLEWPGDAATE